MAGQVTFNAKLVSTGHHNPRKPTKVVQKSTGRTLARYESRRECGTALGIHESYVSLLIYGRLKMKLVDEKHGELEILDDPVFKAKLVHQGTQRKVPSDTTSPRPRYQLPSSSERSGSPWGSHSDDDPAF